MNLKHHWMMGFMMHKHGEIVLVNLNPQKNNEASNVRPCVVVSDTDVNEILDRVTIISCTTNILGSGLFRIHLSPRESLEKECEVMIEQVRGVSKKRILQSLGFVDDAEMKKIKNGLKALLGL